VTNDDDDDVKIYVLNFSTTFFFINIGRYSCKVLVLLVRI
jgi:hypothetical protein